MENTTKSTRQVDVAIIGAGSAGLPAFRAVRKHTENLVLIEGGTYGTTCARVGCMPSKLLIAAAEAAHSVEAASGFGIETTKAVVNGKQVMGRVRSERDRFVGFVLEGVKNIAEKFHVRSQARFIDAQTLELENEIIKAKSIVIATGSSPALLPMFKDLGERLIVNDDVFDWETLPESVAVFGPGVIGLELGQALHRLGVRIRMFGVQKLLGPLTDLSVREYAEKTFQQEFYLDTDAKVKSLELNGDQVKICFVDREDSLEKEENFDFVLTATGRTPNVKNLGLENTGLELDPRGVPVFDAKTMQCGESSIFIAGDANNSVPLLHEAADEGAIAGDNAGRFPNIKPGLRRSPLAVVFCDPQIAMVGQSWKELEEQDNVVVGKTSFEGQGRSRVMLKNKGLMHLYADRETGLFLGSEFMGPQAEHLAHLLSWAHQQKMTIPQMLEMPFYHPVIEEGLRAALRGVNAQLN
ncbi:MAG: dihydrolipoyl dehydrogenase [SAR324 cluster bacterium]|nr:dihydrolipoyl dehydrogenase [SAR324 cluster bacterium]MBL7035217.1 dihydrolipoyl dehydrogenase [SAR324 cluster bacterium]